VGLSFHTHARSHAFRTNLPYPFALPQAASPDLYWYDNVTQSAVGYFSKTGADAYTAAGTWITYNDETSMKAIAAYAVKMQLGGVFAFDLSMDTMSGSAFTFGLHNAIADALKA